MHNAYDRLLFGYVHPSPGTHIQHNTQRYAHVSLLLRPTASCHPLWLSTIPRYLDSP